MFTTTLIAYNSQHPLGDFKVTNKSKILFVLEHEETKFIFLCFKSLIIFFMFGKQGDFKVSSDKIYLSDAH